MILNNILSDKVSIHQLISILLIYKNDLRLDTDANGLDKSNNMGEVLRKIPRSSNVSRNEWNAENSVLFFTKYTEMK